VEVVTENGGLNRMIGWNKPKCIDSGGFHILNFGCDCIADEMKERRNFSGARRKTLLKIAEGGAYFRSYVDGNLYCISPEISIQIQKRLGADIILAFDECTPFHSTRDYTVNSMNRSHRWEMRGLREFRK
jgi:queuine tRNA-ribosyltransferase